MRSRQERGHPPQLAFSPRSPHRRLSAHSQSLERGLIRARQSARDLCRLDAALARHSDVPSSTDFSPSIDPSARFSMTFSLEDATKPSALGFRMPAEWERHEATWLGWPHEL